MARAALAAFIVLIAIWAVTSSALRAPPLALIGKHVAKPSQPCSSRCRSSASASQCGGTVSRPRLARHRAAPSVRAASAALALVTLGLVAAERKLGGARRGDWATDALDRDGGGPAPTPLVLVAVGVAALAFQAHVFIDSGPLYLRLASAPDLPLLAPTFWVGFNLALMPFTLAARRWPTTRVMVGATVLAAVAAGAARFAPSLSLLVTAQFLAGSGWAGALVAAFAWATGKRGTAGTFAGALSSLLALATLIRMASVAAGWPQAPDLRDAMRLVAGGGLARRQRGAVCRVALADARRRRDGMIEGPLSRAEWNGSRYDPASSSGHYESWFPAGQPPRAAARVLDPLHRLQHEGPTADAFGEIWAIYFDGERGRKVVVKESVPLARCRFSRAAAR